MTDLKSLWVVLRTGTSRRVENNSSFYLEFDDPRKSYRLLNRPGDDLERYQSTTYQFDVPGLTLYDFREGNVHLKHDGTHKHTAWECRAVLVLGIGETDGQLYPLVAMPNVNRWISIDSPNGLQIQLEILRASEVGLPLPY